MSAPVYVVCPLRGHSIAGVGVSVFPEKCVTKVYGSTLFAKRGGGWVSNIQEENVEGVGGYQISRKTNVT